MAGQRGTSTSQALNNGLLSPAVTGTALCQPLSPQAETERHGFSQTGYSLRPPLTKSLSIRNEEKRKGKNICAFGATQPSQGWLVYPQTTCVRRPCQKHPSPALTLEARILKNTQPRPHCTSACQWVLSHVRLCNLWTVVCQAPLSMGLSRQEYWSGLPFHPPKDLTDPGIKLASPASSALQADSLPLSHCRCPQY